MPVTAKLLSCIHCSSCDLLSTFFARNSRINLQRSSKTNVTPSIDRCTQFNDHTRYLGIASEVILNQFNDHRSFPCLSEP